MHTHDSEPCWSPHCAPHLTHHDAATRELIAAAEARAAERAWDEAVRECHDLGWLHDFARSDAVAHNPYRDERPAPEPPSDVTEDEVAEVVRQARMTPYEDGMGGWLWQSAGSDEMARAILAAFHVTRRDGTR